MEREKDREILSETARNGQTRKSTEVESALFSILGEFNSICLRQGHHAFPQRLPVIIFKVGLKPEHAVDTCRTELNTALSTDQQDVH